MRMLDLFCGRLGWSIQFLERGWDVVAVDLVEPPNLAQLQAKYPKLTFLKVDVLEIQYLQTGFWAWGVGFPLAGEFDFICASSPCEQFSVHGMKHFHPNPPYPELGIKLFEHTRAICEASGIPYVMENVRAAQSFVGNAKHHCGAFHLWGSGVPPLLPKNIIKGWEHKYIDSKGRKRGGGPGRYEWSTSEGRIAATAKVATIPPELANCVADYAERILGQGDAVGAKCQ